MTISVQFESGNVTPRIVRITTTSTLAQVIAAGWYSNKAPNQLNPSDEVEVAYAQGTSSAATGIFSVSISAGVVTLSAAESSVIFPVVSGDFANFSGTAGAISDAGFSPSNPAKTKVVMANAATIVGQLPMFTDVNGTIGDSGILASSFQPLVATVTFNTAQMVTAYDTPLQIIANPLASQLIIVHSATVYTASTGHTAYATGTAPIIQYSSGGTNGAHGAGTIATASGLVAGDITAAASQVRTLLQAATAAVTGLSGLGIYFSNATGDYTAGTGTNITITLVYEVLTATV
jgi:hypothetical protein